MKFYQRFAAACETVFHSARGRRKGARLRLRRVFLPFDSVDRPAPLAEQRNSEREWARKGSAAPAS